MSFRAIYLVLVILLGVSFSKSLIRQDYLDGYVKFDLEDSDQIVAVLPFQGASGLSASDYSSLYLGKYYFGKKDRGDSAFFQFELLKFGFAF